MKITQSRNKREGRYAGKWEGLHEISDSYRLRPRRRAGKDLPLTLGGYAILNPELVAALGAREFWSRYKNNLHAPKN